MASQRAAVILSLVLLLTVTATSGSDVSITTSYGGAAPQVPPSGVDQDLLNITRVALMGVAPSGPLTRYRAYHVLGLAQYEALVPYLEKSIGPLTGPTPYRMPAPSCTLKNKKTSIFHAIFTAFTLAYPNSRGLADDLAKALLRFGADPNDKSMGTTPAGIGNKAGKAIAAFIANDGSNSAGNLPNKEVTFMPFSDYTGFVPVNTAYKFKHKNKWQPQIDPIANDFAYVQQYIGAQGCAIKMSSLPNATKLHVRKPGKWMKALTPEYKAAAELVLDYSRRLHGNDTAKVVAEFAGAPIPNLLNVWWAAAMKYKWSFDEQVKNSFALYAGIRDATTVVLCWKRIYNTARPVSVIRSSGLFNRVVTYRGPKLGSISIPASEWTEYLGGTPPEPEYPSGAAAIFSTVAQLGSRLANSEALGVRVIVPKGLSRIESGVSPRTDVTLVLSTWDQVAQLAVEGRVLGGVHFLQGTEEGYAIGKTLGNAVFEWVDKLFKGHTP